MNLPGALDVVVVRGLTLKALTLPGTGIAHVGNGNLLVENCVLDGWTTGVSTTVASSRVLVKNTTFRNNVTGLFVDAATARVSADGSFFEMNSFGLAVARGQATVTRSVASGNSIGLLSGSGNAPGAGAQLIVQFCQVSHNIDGIRAQYGGNARVSDSTISGNSSFGLNNPVAEGGGGTMERFGTNLMGGNGANFGGTITVGTLQ